MKTLKYPFRYYAFLLLMLLFSILLWLLFFKLIPVNNLEIKSGVSNKSLTEKQYWKQEYLPEHIAEINPIDTTKIINDTLNNRRIVSNLVNIAIKNSTNSIAKFANK